MPSFRRVSFSERNHYSRLPHDDELYVMKAFARHADNCDSCYDPYQVYKDGSTLCPRGHQKALDVAQYVYNKGGQSYSQVDRERNQRVQIEIPANCEAVRQLLKAMERGLRVMRKSPPSSYDKTYYVPARLSVPDNQRSVPIIRPSTSSSSSVKRSGSTKSSQRESSPPRSKSQSRARASSTSSVSSVGSTSGRSTRGAWVRSRSKDGKRSHSPIYVRPGISRMNPEPSTHSRNNSYSSTSSRSSSIFSRGSSRNSSISSESSRDHNRNSISNPPPQASSKIAFRDPNYQEPIYRTIAPKDRAADISPPVSPIKSSTRRMSRR